MWWFEINFAPWKIGFGPPSDGCITDMRQGHRVGYGPFAAATSVVGPTGWLHAVYSKASPNLMPHHVGYTPDQRGSSLSWPIL